MLNFLRRIISPRNPFRLLYHKTKAYIAAFIYRFPAKKLIVIGVTGTDGKTTTVKMIADILEGAQKKVGATSTVYFKIGKKEFINTTKKTTLSPFYLQRLLKDMVKAGIKYAVVETTSHAISQGRIAGIPYDIAVITNTSREHLDYHITMEDYRKTKGLLFKRLNKSFRKKGVLKTSVLNINDETFKDFSRFKVDCLISYGINKKADVRAENIKVFNDSSFFDLAAPQGKIKIKLSIPGEVNIENALAASSAALALGVQLKTVKKVLEKFKGVPGRMERVRNDKEFNIIIDYAVTPSALEKLYSAIKKIKKPKNKIIAILGCCGERDQGKRPIMGQIVGSYATHTILTNEDPYFEDPWQILGHLEIGLKKTGKKEGVNYWKIMDRRKAIRMAIALLKKEDYLILTGKGGETNMRIGDRDMAWNERRVVEEELGKVG